MKTGWYWWGFRRIWFMPAEKKGARTTKLAKQFLAGISAQTGKIFEEGTANDLKKALRFVEMEEHVLSNGLRYLTFGNEWGQDMTEIAENPYAEVGWVKAP